MISAQRIEEIVKACLFKDDEATEPRMEGQGVMSRMGFHPERLKEHEEEIREMLRELPDDFHASKGGGTSFLNACMDRDGNHWGEHRNIDLLLILGNAIGDAQIIEALPAAMLPGGMPYIMVGMLDAKGDAA